MKFSLAVVCLLSGFAFAQTGEALPRDAVRGERVAEILEFLASDDLAGRDSPSRGLDRARAYLVDALGKIGLAHAGKLESYEHHYTLPGVELPADGFEVRVTAGDREIALVAGEDVRLWRASGAFSQADAEVLRVDAGGAAKLRRRMRGRKPVLVEVDEESALWRAHGGVQQKLGSRRSSSGRPPWLLVRRGLLPDGEIRMSLDVPAPRKIDVQLSNVIGVIEGAEKPEEFVLFSAHYDHVGIGIPRDGDPIYNGADDNGTGTTAVLALAEAFAARREKLPRSLAFVFFSAEEKGLRGSRAFAADPPMPLDNIVANVNIEMLGRPWQPLTAWVTGRKLSDFEQIAAAAMARAGIETEPFQMESMLFGASDNFPLAQAGVVAHSISASTLHQDYHGPGDQFDRIDVDNMTALIRGIYEAGVDFASMADRPAFNEQGLKRLQPGGEGRPQSSRKG